MFSACGALYSGHLHALYVINERHNKSGKTSLELVTEHQARLYRSSVLRDGGMTTVDTDKMTCREVNEPALGALVEFLLTKHPDWRPVDLKVSVSVLYSR